MEQATLAEEPKVKPKSPMKNIDLTSKMSQSHNAPHKVDKASKYNFYDKDTHPDGENLCRERPSKSKDELVGTQSQEELFCQGEDVHGQVIRHTAK